MLVGLKNTEIVEGSKLELPVRLSNCYPIPSSEWTKDNQNFIQDENHQIESINTDHKLIVLKATESDGGSYKFKSSNELGSVETECQASILSNFFKKNFFSFFFF